MGVSPLMSLGVKAMTANYAALQTTGHNIANANVAGYSRQNVLLATSPGQFTGSGYFGRGVDVASVQRTHSAFLTRETDSARSLASMDAARLDQLKRLEAVFQPGEAGLGHATSELFDAMVDVSSQPADMATRQVVLARAGDLAARFSEAGQALDGAQGSVHAAIKTSVGDINRLAQSVARSNDRIAALQGSGQPANDLLDERDRLIAQLADQVQVTRIDADDGSVGIFIGGGQRLVLGARAVSLQVVSDPADSSRSAIAITDGFEPRMVGESALGGGALAGLMRYQNTDLVQARSLVGQLAAAVGHAVNGQQQRGITLGQPLGQATGQAMFSIGLPQALSHADNARDADRRLIGSAALTITDPGALEASDYDLRESTAEPGRWQVTRLSDGASTTIDSGDVVDGVRIDIGNAQPGDRFLLQPVSRAANGMQSLLTDGSDVAAASLLLARAPAANGGTAVVGSLVVDTAPLPYPAQSDTLTFTRNVPPVDGHDYSVTSSLSGETRLWQSGQALAGGNGYTLRISGVPADGDTIVVDPTPASAVRSNNGNALALVDMRDAALVAGHTATDAWSTSLADVGVRVQSAQTSADIAAAVAEQAERARSSSAGVNLDEEAARLIQYQQSYQAAAKMLQVAQTLFDTLLSVAGR